jgi:hypothetical protein
MEQRKSAPSRGLGARPGLHPGYTSSYREAVSFNIEVLALRGAGRAFTTRGVFQHLEWLWAGATGMTRERR